LKTLLKYCNDVFVLRYMPPLELSGIHLRLAISGNDSVRGQNVSRISREDKWDKEKKNQKETREITESEKCMLQIITPLSGGPTTPILNCPLIYMKYQFISGILLNTLKIIIMTSKWTSLMTLPVG